MVSVSKVAKGRGAWPGTGTGGTLDITGTGPGSYYRAPKAGSSMAMPGSVGARAVKEGGSVTLNDYAVYLAVKVLQPYFGAEPDGVLGPKTEAAIKGYQKTNGLWVDGVIGDKTTRSLFSPLVTEAAASVRIDPRNLIYMTLGHITVESVWDLGAVGFETPDDLGIAQVNRPSHPAMTVEACFTPRVAIRWMVELVDGNLIAMHGNTSDAIAAYNLGRGGARSWISDGRPDVWTRSYSGQNYTTNVKEYIDKVWAAGQ